METPPNSMLKSIGAFVCVRSREVVRFWEGPLGQSNLVSRTNRISIGTQGAGKKKNECHLKWFALLQLSARV